MPNSFALGGGRRGAKSRGHRLSRCLIIAPATRLRARTAAQFSGEVAVHIQSELCAARLPPGRKHGGASLVRRASARYQESAARRHSVGANGCARRELSPLIENIVLAAADAADSQLRACAVSRRGRRSPIRTRTSCLLAAVERVCHDVLRRSPSLSQRRRAWPAETGDAAERAGARGRSSVGRGARRSGWLPHTEYHANAATWLIVGPRSQSGAASAADRQ